MAANILIFLQVHSKNLFFADIGIGFPPVQVTYRSKITTVKPRIVKVSYVFALKIILEVYNIRKQFLANVAFHYFHYFTLQIYFYSYLILKFLNLNSWFTKWILHFGSIKSFMKNRFVFIVIFEFQNQMKFADLF